MLKKWMIKFLSVFIIFILYPLSLILVFSGCASVQTPGYISRADHPYDRKIYAGFEKVASAFLYVLKNQGWKIDCEVDPSIYERDDRYDNNGYQNLLIITDARKKSLHLSNAYLNVFIHSINNTCDVEIRYEAQTHVIKQFTFVRDDQLIQGILDAVEQEVGR